jgi:hypothetical protein
MMYKESSIKKQPNEGNCQDFVFSLIEHLGINVKFSGALEKFLTNMREKGLCDMVIELDKNFQSDFGLKILDNKVTFTTHTELDKFVKSLIENENINFLEKYPNEYSLLKSFDRAFWMRQYFISFLILKLSI